MSNGSGPSSGSDEVEPAEAHPLPSPERVQELLFDAARLGRTDVIPAVLHAGADLTARDARGYTALILASYNGQAEATRLLLERGAGVDQPDTGRGNTALMGVAFKGYRDIFEILLAAGADPHALNKAGQTALMMAAPFGHVAITERLLGIGANPHLEDAAGNSALSVAEMQGNSLMLELLRGADTK